MRDADAMNELRHIIGIQISNDECWVQNVKPPAWSHKGWCRVSCVVWDVYDVLFVYATSRITLKAMDTIDSEWS